MSHNHRTKVMNEIEQGKLHLSTMFWRLSRNYFMRK